jgi:hypothetical protein
MVTRMMDRMRQALCGILHGHDNLLQFERDRMFLKCVSCGHESPGWELTEPAPVPVRAVPRTEAPRTAIAQPQLVSARRIA